MRTRLLLPALYLVLCYATPSTAADEGQSNQDALKRLSIEELMNVDVTLTSRRPEPLVTTPAAVSVLSNDDIRRSGVTTLADAVGLATGVTAARFNNGSWSITARGFNAVTANKMLVMIDGRTVYSPLFSGVFWNAIDYTLEDIDRIEVIRGPGAALWGANAVNGVVNIVTRSALSTRGAYTQVGGGNEDGLAEFRVGGGSGSNGYRVYGKYARRGSQLFADGSSAGDRRDRGQVGFRVDRGQSGTTLMFKGDAFFSEDQLPDRPSASFFIGDLQARWARAVSSRSDVQVQAYLNHERREVPLQLTHRLTTVDIDGQHTLSSPRHQFVWGGGLRVNTDVTERSAVIGFAPADRTYPVLNVFAQDEYALIPDRLSVTPGVKIERNAFSGAEFQPGVRSRLLLPAGQTLWGSVARAIRRPTRFDEDIRVTLPTGLLVAQGNPDFAPERLIAAELGYRVQPTPITSLDVTLFHQAFDRLRSQEAPAAGGVPITVGNTLNGTSFGIELALGIEPAEWWRMQIAYVGQDVSVTRDAGSRDVAGGSSEANDPAHQFSLRSAFDVLPDVEIDLRLRHVSELPQPRVPGYSELAARVSWSPDPRVTLAIVGEDLLHAHHPEFNPTARGFEEFQRSVRATLTLRTR